MNSNARKCDSPVCDPATPGRNGDGIAKAREKRDAVCACMLKVESMLKTGEAVADVRAALLAGGALAEIVDDAIATVTDSQAGIIATPLAGTIIPLPSSMVPIIESAKTIFPLLATLRKAFWRGGRACELIEDGGQTGIEPMRPEAFRSRIEALGIVGTWIKSDAGKIAFSPKRASREDCIALLATREAAELLPPIESVYASPVLVLHGGKVHRLGKGYHETEGGALVTGGATVAPIVAPETAAADIKALLVDYQFATAGDETRALAAILTPALVFGRFLRGPCPVFVAEANLSQTGKDYLCKTVCKVYGEEASLVAQRTGGVGGFDESLQERMVAGRPFIHIANLRGHIDSQFIEATLTAGGRIGCRIPHRGEIHVDARRFVFMATSNGIKSTTDFANRACIIRLRKQSSGHAWHEWPEGGLWEHVEANASHYQAAVHALVEAWHVAGAPRMPKMDHDFRDWAGAVSSIISMAWPEATPLLDGHRAAQERTANPALSWLREVALAVAEEGRGGEELSATAIAELCAERGVEIPGLRDGTDEGKAAKLVGYTMRRCLGEADEVTIEGHIVRALAVTVKRDDGNGYYPSKRYTFTAPENPGDHSNHSKGLLTSERTSDSVESNTALLGVTVGNPQPDLNLSALDIAPEDIDEVCEVIDEGQAQ